jgi:hypothetical protein
MFGPPTYLVLNKIGLFGGLMSPTKCMSDNSFWVTRKSITTSEWFLPYCGLFIRVLLRLEFQVAHSILNVTLATDQKWPLSQIHIS